MIPIIAGSILGLAIIIERYWVLRSVRMNTKMFVRAVIANVQKNRIQAALDLCEKKRNHPVAAIFKIALEKRNLPLERLEKIMEQEGTNQILRLEKRLGGLASIIGIEPLLGFLGTITGLIRAFMSWEKAGANITVNALAAGIYEAMITTAAGLMVAIPFYLCYNYFVSQVKYIAADATNQAMQLAEVLHVQKIAQEGAVKAYEDTGKA
jgi:biopolymer transport protein ExbB